MTHLAVAIFVHDLESALADVAAAARRGAEMVEFRIDQFTADPRNPRELAALIRRSPLPCIVTCRPTWEGGLYDGDETHRIATFRAAADAHPAYIDLELKAYLRDPDALNNFTGGLILSSHDFRGRPPDLFQSVEAMVHAHACRVVKVAWAARSLRDNVQAFELLEAQHKPTIALCMGEAGLPSRVLAKKFGALLTFASTSDSDTGTAPGQVSIDTLKKLYRWDALRHDTRVFGVIGHPVAHSMSPAIHNAGFDAAGFNGVYLPLPIPPEYEHFKATVATWLDYKPLDFRGASVTIPHKENLLRFVTEQGGEIEPLAKTIGAANTLTVRDDGSLYASNTDYAAALDSVCDAMGLKRDQLRDLRIGVIGAGGAARAVVAGFTHVGATVTVFNRTPARAERLAEEFSANKAATGGRGLIHPHVVAASLDAIADSVCDVLINCTPIGMHPNVDASPLASAGPINWPRRGPQVVFDTIYNPMRTRLLRDAAERGCKTIGGVEMFVRQGAAQFERWTGLPAPVDLFRGMLTERLGGEIAR
ncbi:MAG: shikimate dehydrogenase [Phycisphaeraceae bacterium]